MSDITLCRPTGSPPCRQTCFRYRAIEHPYRQSYADYSADAGLMCPYRMDIALQNPNRYVDWRIVDEYVKQQPEIVK